MAAISRDQATKFIAVLQGKSLECGIFTDQNTEVTGTGYARVALTASAPIDVPGIGLKTTNQGDISFGAAGSDWVPPPSKVTWVKVFDTADGKVVFAGQLASNMQVSIVTGQPFEIKAGSLGLLFGTYD